MKLKILLYMIGYNFLINIKINITHSNLYNYLLEEEYYYFLINVFWEILNLFHLFLVFSSFYICF